MAHLLRLISGYDKRNPIRTFTICSSSSTANVHLREGGFSPGFGEETVQWSGKTIRRDGQKRVRTGVDNVEIDLTYDLIGGSTAELGYLQREINRFFLEVRMYEEDKQAAPVWLEYRWQDGLDAIPAPVFGQFSQYLRVLYGRAGKWPGELHAADRLTAGNIEGVVARLICGPYWEGLQQTAAIGVGQLELTPHGVLVPGGTATNVITNPSFGHATFSTGWTAESTLQAINETRAGFYRSLRSAVRLTNTTAGTLKYTQTLTLTAVVYIISCFVRREDGAAVTSADCVMYGQGAAQTTTFTQVEGGVWYLAWASFTGVAASSTHGIQVKAGKQVYVDDFQCEIRHPALLFPSPFISGVKVGCTWSGTAHASSSSRVTGFQKWNFTDELTSQFTFACWFTPYWSTAAGTGFLFVARYAVTAADVIDIYFLPGTNVFTLSKTIDSVTVTDAGAVRAIAYRDRLHIAVIQDETNLRLYVNGVLDSSLTLAVAAKSAAGGVFSLGGDAAGNNPGFAAMDGARIWKQAFTAAQVLSLYTAEVEIKTVVGGLIGEAPYLWTKDGDNILDAVDDTNRNHWGVVGGVSGDVEALTEWRIQPPTSTPPRCYWLGRKATDEAFDAALLFMEQQGTVDANSSGGEYETQTSAGAMAAFEIFSGVDFRVFQGRYQFLSRFYTATNSVNVYPVYHLSTGNNAALISGKSLTVATNANFLLRDFGDLFITYPPDRQPPSTIVIYLSITPVTGTATERTDFIQLLPWPCCRVISLDTSITIAAGDLLIINGTEAYVRQNSTTAHLFVFEHRGDVVDVVPNKYNTIFFLPGEEGTTYDVTDTGTFTVLITPRYTLPGGLVA